MNVQYGHKITDRKVKEKAEVYLAFHSQMFSLREETRVPEGFWSVQDLFQGNGKQGIDPGYYKKQLVNYTMDPLVDMFNRIRNALAVGKEQVEVPYSAKKLSIAKILERLGYVKSVDSKGRKVKRTIEIVLKYRDTIPAITGLRKISKQGNRVYASASKLFRVKKKDAVVIFSTSKGIMTDGEAREQKIGGEVLCEVW